MANKKSTDCRTESAKNLVKTLKKIISEQKKMLKKFKETQEKNKK